MVTDVFTDGACLGNPGPGGWAFVVDEGLWSSGFEAHTTNQRMELTAASAAVQALEGPLRVHSDSTYVVNCFLQEWWKGWLICCIYCSREIRIKASMCYSTTTS